MSRNQRVQSYVEKSTEMEIDRLAEENGQTRSEYIADVLDEHIRRQKLAEVSKQRTLEQRLEALLAQQQNEILDTMDGTTDALALGAVHAIATWELLKQPFEPIERKDAFETARNRLTDDVVRMGLDPDALADTPESRQQPEQSQPTGHRDDTDDEYSQDWEFS